MLNRVNDFLVWFSSGLANAKPNKLERCNSTYIQIVNSKLKYSNYYDYQDITRARLKQTNLLVNVEWTEGVLRMLDSTGHYSKVSCLFW